MRAARVVNLFAAQTFYDRCRASNLRCPPALYDQLLVPTGVSLWESENSIGHHRDANMVFDAQVTFSIDKSAAPKAWTVCG